jgi:hypothetical protein
MDQGSGAMQPSLANEAHEKPHFVIAPFRITGVTTQSVGFVHANREVGLSVDRILPHR